MKSKALLTAMLAACAPLAAQPTHMNMPEGSRDVFLSLAAGSAPRSAGSARREAFVTPLISAQWANGVFVNMNTLGIHLSEQADMRYGLAAAPGMSRAPGGGRGTERKFTPEVGGFFDYSLGSGIGLGTRLMYGGSHDRRGLRMDLSASMWVPLAAHHDIGLETRLRLANRSALQATFGVTPQQAAAGRFGVHDVSGGVRDVSLGAQWRWHFSNKYTLTTLVEWQRLQGSAAASPRTEKPAGVTAATILTYRF